MQVLLWLLSTSWGKGNHKVQDNNKNRVKKNITQAILSANQTIMLYFGAAVTCNDSRGKFKWELVTKGFLFLSAYAAHKLILFQNSQVNAVSY